MASFTSGILKVVRSYEKAVKANIREALDADLADAALLMETRIAELTPVVTGRLKGSIIMRKLGALKYEVATNVEYAAPVEFGTSKFAGRAMFRKGAAKVEADQSKLFRRIKNLK